MLPIQLLVSEIARMKEEFERNTELIRVSKVYEQQKVVSLIFQ